MDKKEIDPQVLTQLKQDLPPAVYMSFLAIVEISRGNFDICPYCGTKIEFLEQVGRSVYSSCGHRLYLGLLDPKLNERLQNPDSH